MMRTDTRCTTWLVVAMMAIMAGGCARNGQSGSPTEGGDELRWARPVADDFLNALTQGNREAGANLLTKRFAANLRDGDPNPARSTSLPVLLGNVWLGDVWKQYGGEFECYSKIASYEIRDEAQAPDRREATFDGEVKMKDGKVFKFRVRVAPEGEDGRWRVDSFVMTA